jgi:hypothetical protein
MNLKLKIYGIDGDDATELEELLWSMPEIGDVETRWRSRDSVPPGTIHASISPTVLTCTFTYIALKFADEAIKDTYKLFKDNLIERLKAWQDEKNANLKGRHRLHFALSENGEILIRHD